ncbi:hypothetical protein ACFSKU_01275 [Pontibacter silvestris]|uniref:Glycosyltransferase RgtA/B/C/D-like domain-containing protein n=1 Tax=Pontibacter silvestris TaxID=2305183 RepID=A0ABW4WS45_9BACT|nr:hypothetical protein [Pontibacter silvestris]MCC9136240.1 hypothetical protein [Pontibacter silvestris]
MSVLVYLLNILLLAGLVWWLYRQPWVKELQPYFFPALVLKLLCGVLLGLLYFQYYGGAGDTVTYYKASLRLTAYAKNDFGNYVWLLLFNEFESEAFRATIPFSRLPDFSNSFYLIKLLSVLNLFTNGAYYLNTLYFSLFSFWGAGRLSAALATAFPSTKEAAVVAFLFFPSVVFWSAGLTKDAIMFGSMCWLVAFAVNRAHSKPVRVEEVLLLPLMLYLFVRIKIFYAALLLPLLLGYLVIMGLSKFVVALKQRTVQVAVFITAFTILVLVATQLRDFLSIEFIVEQVFFSYEDLLQRSLHGPHMVLSLKPTLASMVAHYPEALINAVFRPFMGESWEWLYIIMGLENLLLFILMALSLASLFRKAPVKVELLYVALLLFIFVLGGIIGLSTPNFGSLSRYRVVFLPFLVYLLLQNYYTQKLLNRLQRLP